MNKEILNKLRQLSKDLDKLTDTFLELSDTIHDEGKEKAWFDNGKIIVNGVEYPIENFTVEWKHSSLRDETD